MKKVLLSCMAVAAGAAFAIAQDDAAYPSSLDFTLNGEKELTGVSVSQTTVSESLLIEITGESDAETITMDFAIPEGWDNAYIGSVIGGEDAPFKTRSSHWLPVSLATEQGYKEGHTFSFPVNGLESLGTIYLAKGDNVWEYPIDITFKVLKEGGSADDNQPNMPSGILPEYPEALDITLNGEKELAGVTVTQTMEPFMGDDYLTITVTGECDAKEITINMATPAGWDGMMTYSDYDGGAEEINPLRAKAPANDDEDSWMPLSYAGWLTPGNTIVLPVDGEQWTASAYLVKDQYVYMVNIDVIFDVKKTGGSDVPVVEGPAMPDHLDYTLNGEKELPGVKVRQLIDATTQIFSVTGKCDSDNLTLTFEIPEGWDGMMIADTFGEGEISTVKTRGAELIPVDMILGQGFVEGNSITYATDGEAQWGMIALIKGDKACSTFINYDVTVSKSGSDVPDPSDDEPAFPESYVIDTFPEEGLEVWQGFDDDIYSIGISGEITEPTFTVVIDVPEGWDGFISIPYEDNIVISENGFAPRKTRATDYYWEDIEEVMDCGGIKGNRFTFTPNGEEQDVCIYLYKGDKVEMINWISLETLVSVDFTAANQAAYDAAIADLDALQEKYEAAVAEIKETNPDFDFEMYEEIPGMIEETKQYAEMALNAANEEGESFSNYFYGGVEEIDGYISQMLMAASPAPEFPTSLDVTLSNNEGVQLTVDDTMGIFIINVAGKSSEEELTVTVAVPEGFDGFISIRDIDMDPGIGGGPLSTRAEEADWWPVNYLLEEGFKEGNTMTFPVDGELHSGQFFLCKYGMVDMNNQINVEFEVESADTTGVSGINAAENATYYDLQGNQVVKPAKGLYVKVVDGKATKVVVK